MSRIIECQVNDEYILGSGVPIGAAGSVGNVFLRLKFNEMWDGLAIMATFKDALCQKSVVVMLVPSMCEEGEVRTYLVPIPEEATHIAGRARLTLTGYSVYSIEENDDGGSKIVYQQDSLANTSTAFFRVLESDAAIADDGTMTPDLAIQALAALNEAEALRLETDQMLNNAIAAEAERSTAEIARENAESGRMEAEKLRAENEAIRISNENARIEVSATLKSALGNLLTLQEIFIEKGVGI